MDLQFLRPLYEQPGDYVSVYLDTSRDSEDAAHAVGLRWRAARERLAAAGAAADTLDAVAEVLTDPGRAAPGRAVFAQDGVVRLTEPLPHPPRREIAQLDRLPHVMPLLAQRAPHVPHLRVEARRDGGEILAVSGHDGNREEELTGTGWPVHKTGRGGWSARRYDDSAEEAWEVNAKELAERVAADAGLISAELIVLGGDVQARRLLASHLPTDLAGRVVEIDAEVSADSATAARAADRAVAGHVAAQARGHFEHWRTQQAHGRGVEGLAATMTALRDAAAAEILLVDHPESARTAWVGPEGTDLADTADALQRRGVPDPWTDRADAAIVRAAALTGAALYFLPPTAGPAAEPAAGAEAGPTSGAEGELTVEAEVKLRAEAEAGPGTGAAAEPADGICALLRVPVAALSDQAG
jgi:Bacterial archaeo-eukaryotic release factor family 2